MYSPLIFLTALMSTQYSGQKFLISLIVPTCVTVAVLLSALIIFQKRKSFKNEQPKKGMFLLQIVKLFTISLLFLWTTLRNFSKAHLHEFGHILFLDCKRVENEILDNLSFIFLTVLPTWDKVYVKIHF